MNPRSPGSPQRDPKRKLVAAWFSEELAQAVELQAQRTHRTKSGYVRHALEKGLTEIPLIKQTA